MKTANREKAKEIISKSNIVVVEIQRKEVHEIKNPKPEDLDKLIGEAKVKEIRVSEGVIPKIVVYVF